MSRTYHVCYSDESINDLRNIFIYIASNLQSPDYAKAQIDRIRSAVKKLQHFPKKNPTVSFEPWTSLEMRRLNVDNYAVLYLVDDDHDRVEIIRIPYGAMDFESVLEDDA